MADPSEIPGRKFRRAKGDKIKEINILLLGETGVGKSTFINAFKNFLSCDKFEQLDKDYESLIPQITRTYNDSDDNLEPMAVSKDDNECETLGQSSTQFCKCYEIKSGETHLIRLIDTPGIGDTKGPEQDDKNLDHILSTIGQFDELHAICFLMLPNLNRLGYHFKYCFEQLLIHFDKSIKDNIIFIYTRHRQSGFEPGDTSKLVKLFLKRIKKSDTKVEIPYNEKNIYYFENDLIEYFENKQEKKINDKKSEEFRESFYNSKNEMTRFIRYIIGSDGHKGLKPHRVIYTKCVNQARKTLFLLTKPLEEIYDNYESNRILLEKHINYLEQDKKDIDVSQLFYIPRIVLNIRKLDQPKTVCLSPSCCTQHIVLGQLKYSFDPICHKQCRCFLFGISNYFCSAINLLGNCKVCGCSHSKHLHIFYESSSSEEKVRNKQIEDKGVYEDKEKSLKDRETWININKDRLNKINEEIQIIKECNAEFAWYLKNNSITTFNDSFQSYLQYSLNVARNEPNSEEKVKKINSLEKMMKDYQEQIDTFEKAIASKNKPQVTTEDVFANIEKLKNLEINGKVLQEVINATKTVYKKSLTKQVHIKPIVWNRILSGIYSSMSNLYSNSK